MSTRKCYFLPHHLPINALNKVLTGTVGSSLLTNKVCLLYTILSQDLISLRLKGDPAGYTQVHSDQLLRIFDKQYPKVIELLLDNDFLEVYELDEETGLLREKGFYSKRLGIARAYRIPSHLRDEEKLFMRTPITPSKVIFNTIDRLNNVTQDPAVLADYYRQAVMRNLEKLVLVDDAETRQLIKVRFERLGLTYSNEVGDAYLAKFNESPLHPIRVCEFAGRLHPEILREPKQFREKMRFEDCLDQPLVEIDLVSSQPWFLSIVNPQLIKRFLPECKDAVPFSRRSRTTRTSSDSRKNAGMGIKEKVSTTT